MLKHDCASKFVANTATTVSNIQTYLNDITSKINELKSKSTLCKAGLHGNESVIYETLINKTKNIIEVERGSLMNRLGTNTLTVTYANNDWMNDTLPEACDDKVIGFVFDKLSYTTLVNDVQQSMVQNMQIARMVLYHEYSNSQHTTSNPSFMMDVNGFNNTLDICEHVLHKEYASSSSCHKDHPYFQDAFYTNYMTFRPDNEKHHCNPSMFTEVIQGLQNGCSLCEL